MLPLAIVGGLFGALPLALTFGPVQDPLGTRVWFGILGFGWLGFFWLRYARIGTRAEDEGLVFVNPFRTYRVRWENLAGFVLRPFGGPLMAAAETVSGRLVWAYGISASWRTAAHSHREAQNLVDELNHLIQRMNPRAQEAARRMDAARPPAALTRRERWLERIAGLLTLAWVACVLSLAAAAVAGASVWIQAPIGVLACSTFAGAVLIVRGHPRDRR